MTTRDDLLAALAQMADDDVGELIDDARREGRALARRQLIEAYAEALVRAVGRRVDEPASADASRLRPSTPPIAQRGCYLYAIVGGAGANAAAGEPGIAAGGRVEAVTVDELTALVSDVDVDALRAGCDEADVSDGGWLANAVRAHERVVLAAFRSAPTLPIRFGVVHPDRAAVQRLLREHADDIGAELERLGGLAEWNVKVFADPTRLERQVSADSVAPAAAGAATDGRAFLLREQARRDLRAQVQSFVRERVEAMRTEMRGVVRDSVDLPHSSSETPVVLAAAYLVARSDERLLTAAVDAFSEASADTGLSITLDGPWPPFHFTSLQVDHGDA